MKGTLLFAGVSGAVCVALGAFAAHSLKNILPAEDLQIFETAVRYQFYHTLALIGVIFVARLEVVPRMIFWSARFFEAGIILFCGSLYLMVFSNFWSEEKCLPAGWAGKWLGAVTPFGGLMFIAGWGALVVAALRMKQK